MGRAQEIAKKMEDLYWTALAEFEPMCRPPPRSHSKEINSAKPLDGPRCFDSEVACRPEVESVISSSDMSFMPSKSKIAYCRRPAIWDMESLVRYKFGRKAPQMELDWDLDSVDEETTHDEA